MPPPWLPLKSTHIYTHTHVEQLCLCRTAFSTQYDGECVNVSVYLLSSVPLIRLPQARRGSRRQQAVKGKPKHLIDAPHKVQTSHNLFFQLGKKERKVRKRSTWGHNNNRKVYTAERPTTTESVKIKPRSNFSGWHSGDHHVTTVSELTRCKQKGSWEGCRLHVGDQIYCRATKAYIRRCKVWKGQRPSFIQAKASWNVSGVIYTAHLITEMRFHVGLVYSVCPT